MKTAAITGASRGIGYATAMALAQNGYRLAICSKNSASLKKAEKELSKTTEVLAVACDMARPEGIRKFVSAAKKRYGAIDVLVNNAGVAYNEELHHQDEARIQETIDVNLRGLILSTKYFLPLLNKDGLIINISSGAGKHGIPGLAVYCATKFGVVGFTEALAGEIKQKVIAVCPGGVDTGMYRQLFGRKPGLKPEDIAAKILEICTSPHRFRSGSAVEVYKPVNDAVEFIRNRYFYKGKSK